MEDMVCDVDGSGESHADFLGLDSLTFTLLATIVLGFTITADKDQPAHPNMI